MEINRKSFLDDITIGTTIGKFKNLLNKGCRDNANMRLNPEMVHKYVADESTKQFALLGMLKNVEAEAHMNGYLHIHDLEFFAGRPINCLQHDLRYFINNGLMVDGDGDHTSVSNGAKHMGALINHIGQILGAGQTNMSGGQSMPFINTFLAPYTANMDNKTLKQHIQSLIFNINMSYVSRGGQTVFSSFNIDLEMPEFLKNEPVAYAGNPRHLDGCYLYGDWQDEAKKIAHTIFEVLLEGDATGKPHLFPNTVVQLNDKVDYDEWNDLFELSAKYSLPYFNKEIDGNYALVMGCRTRLTTGDSWKNDYNLDLLRTGNLAYISLNLPLYALRGVGIKDKRNFWDILSYNLEIATNILIKRRLHAEFCLNETDLLKFLTRPDEEGNPYYRIENSTLSFGIVGLYETVKILNNGEYSDTIAIEILDRINHYARQLTEETGYRWTVISSPAESTAGKFGMINKRKYGDRAIVNGIKGGYYYTNGTHMPVDADILLPEKITKEAPYHRYTQGGNILNIFMGESFSDPETIKNLVKKIYDKSDVGFYTFSSIFALCGDCGSRVPAYIHNSNCHNCKSTNIQVYDRITGYLQRVNGWNDSKQAEFKDRKRF